MRSGRAASGALAGEYQLRPGYRFGVHTHPHRGLAIGLAGTYVARVGRREHAVTAGRVLVFPDAVAHRERAGSRGSRCLLVQFPPGCLDDAGSDRLFTRDRIVDGLAAQRLAGGPAALSSTKRGRPSNRRLDAALRERVLALVKADYSDFGPTLANEKLRDLHGSEVSTETLRQWMLGDGVWVPRARRRRIHQPRNRRDCLGELVQIDGSLHHWFEDRGPRVHAFGVR